MRNRFHLALIEQKSRLDQGLAVAGRAGAHNGSALRELGIDLLDGADGRL